MKFIDWLRTGQALDGELIAEGGEECSASLVWDEDCTITDYGHQQFKTIMEAECSRVSYGIVVYQPEGVGYDEFYAELNRFAMCAAGYTDSAEYDKIFG